MEHKQTGRSVAGVAEGVRLTRLHQDESALASVEYLAGHVELHHTVQDEVRLVVPEWR